MTFDYGGDIAEKESHLIHWEKSGARTALVDADLLPYIIGFITPELAEAQAKALVEAGYCKTIYDTPQFEDVFDSVCMTLNAWIRNAQCDSARLFLTNGAENFRLRIAYTDDYKGQRVADKPPFFHEIRSMLITELDAEVSRGNEADDELSIAAWEVNYQLLKQGIELGSQMHKDLCNVVIISSDKDSTITPTWHYNPDTQKLSFNTPLGELLPSFSDKEVNDYQYVGTGEYWKSGAKKGQEKTKRVLVGKRMSQSIKKLKGSGLKFFYAQVIMGDPADNYKGLQGKGMTFAYETLNSCSTEKELYLATLAAYKSVYGTGLHLCKNYEGKVAYLSAYDRMLEQGRLAWMQTRKGEIWRSAKGKIPYIDSEIWEDASS